MYLKFNTSKEITYYLYMIQHLKYESEGIKISAYIFNNKNFNSSNDVLDYLIELQIVNEVSKPQRKFGTVNTVEYIFQYYLMNTHYLNSLTSNLWVNPEININRLLSINEVCTLLNVTRPTVYKLINEGKLDHYIIVGQKKIKYLDVLNYIESNKA